MFSVECEQVQVMPILERVIVYSCHFTTIVLVSCVAPSQLYSLPTTSDWLSPVKRVLDIIYGRKGEYQLIVFIEKDLFQQ